MSILDLFFDRRCCLCGKHINTGAVCSDCHNKIVSLVKLRKRILDVCGREVELYCVFDYDEPIVKELLFKLKRFSNSDLFRYASHFYYRAVPKDFCGVVTVCPRRKKNLRDYGYDHVQVPCSLMCKQREERFEFVKLIKRNGHSKEQKKLSLSERKENTRGAFKVIKKDIPENILIVDDVVTTASTMSSCIEEILKCRNDVKIIAICLASRNAFACE